MRNLQLRKRWQLPSAPAGQNLTGTAWDGENIICSYGPSSENSLLELRRWQSKNSLSEQSDESILITSFDAFPPNPDLEFDKVLSLYYLPEKATICLVLVGGDIILVREDPLPEEEKIEIVGSVEAGLTAASWSPDGELLVLATRADTLLFMTREFENSVSATFTEDDLKASKHVSVGWGKKETQFTGKGARALRDPTMPEKVDEGTKSAFDDDSTAISWRGDGQYFAVSSRQASSRRVIRVYSREGILDGVSEPVDGLEAALSWRPAGNIIASVQRRADQVDVVFFERNGLRHGEFTLRDSPSLSDAKDPKTSVSLSWNCDSTVLAVCLLDRVQFWTMGNYHYYLKQEIITTILPSSQAPTIIWDAEQPLRCIMQQGHMSEALQFSPVVSRSPAWSSQTGTVAVIDGQTLKLTSLRHANVPPPMAQNEISLQHNIVSVAVHSDGEDEYVAVLESCSSTVQSLSVFCWRPQTRDYREPMLIFSEKMLESRPLHTYRNVTFVTKDRLILLGGNGQLSYVRSITVVEGTDASAQPDISCVTESIMDVSSFLENSEHNVYTVSYTGAIVSHKLESIIEGPPSFSRPTLKLPSQLESFSVVSLESTRPFGASNDIATTTMNGGELTKNMIVFGQTRSGALYANERCLIKDCTSFVVTSAHLVFTTSKHLLKFVHLSAVDDLVIPPDTPEADERCRAVERGAKLVTVISATAAVILQMPRGNLETIFPRALVLAEIRRNIDNKQYKKAFMTCRKQRVDMNILYDYNPDQMISNVDLFVEQIQKVEHVDLFLSQLRDEDVSISMYKNTLPKAEADRLEAVPRSGNEAKGKVNRISDAFLPVLRNRASTNLQNVITAHVVRNPPDIEAGLLEVAKFQARGGKDAARAVEHICFLVDVNRLYESALGLYDLRLAVLVAEKAQKDPREYLPLLQRLNGLPLPRRKYEIDDYLFRHGKALADLWELDDFEEYKKYAAKHELYEDALHACRYEENKYRHIMTLYASFLAKQTKHREAGIAFEYLQQYATASESYELAHMWRESLSCASMANYDTQRLRFLATSISNTLVEHKEYHAAATIARDYLQDIESAARLFCRGYLFADAIALLSLQGRSNLIPDIVDGGLTQCMGSTTELLADCRAQIKAQVPRIRELRTKRIEEPLAYYEGTNAGGADIPDNVSLAATDASTMGGSLFTRYTGKQSGTIGTNATRRSAKNRRKEERKRAQGKKGTIYEEEYLVNSVARLIERINSVGDEVERLVTGLMRRGMREQARAVEAAMKDIVEACEGCRDEVFQIHKPIQPASGHPAGQLNSSADPLIPEGEDLQAETPAVKEPPVIKKWEGLSLVRR